MAPIARVEPKVLKAVEGQQMVQVNAQGVAATTCAGRFMVSLERAGIATRTGEENGLPSAVRPAPAEPTATIWVISDPVEPKAPEPGAILVARTDLIPGGPLGPPRNGAGSCATAWTRPAR